MKERQRGREEESERKSRKGKLTVDTNTDRKSEMIKFGVEIGKEGEERSFYRENDFFKE